MFRAAGPFPCGNAFFDQYSGKPPFTLSGNPGDGSYQSSLANETRHSSLARKFPDRAKDLFAKSEAAAQARFDHLQKLVELYK